MIDDEIDFSVKGADMNILSCNTDVVNYSGGADQRRPPVPLLLEQDTNRIRKIRRIKA